MNNVSEPLWRILIVSSVLWLFINGLGLFAGIMIGLGDKDCAKIRTRWHYVFGVGYEKSCNFILWMNEPVR